MTTMHCIDYIEISVNDLKIAKKFYSEAFGWTFKDYGENYAGIKGKDDSEMGGLASDGEQPTGGSPLVVLLSDNLEQSLESTKRAGGTVTVPVFEFPGGRRFHFRDPSGNELAVWQKC